MSVRRAFLLLSLFLTVSLAGLALLWPAALWGFAVLGPVIALGLEDMLQKKKAVRRNFPLLGRGRYLMEAIRPEIQQYFVESNIDGRPFNREERSLVYQRAKGAQDTLPFGTQRDVYEPGHEWINHSLAPAKVPAEPPRVTVGESTCEAPYAASLLNVSAMSYGALSSRAIEALNRGAAEGKFAHCTGEGGISPHHLHGGDLIWQVGTGYFGCRDDEGRFDLDAFASRATTEPVKMVEIKLSQGAKPGHGGILPAEKITPEIAEIRGVPLGRDVLSPPAHTTFATPRELMHWLGSLRQVSGKPIGIKLCLGERHEFMAMCRAMVETGHHPDYITVDGAEGGTGAAPAEFSNSLGTPLTDALVFVHQALVATGLRERVRLVASGKIATGFGIVRMLSLGADFCYSARAMMLALGCIQARHCNNNRCPVGVATQDPQLVVGLDVGHKTDRVARYQRQTVHAALELIAAAGLTHPSELTPRHILRRLGTRGVESFEDHYDSVEPGSLLAGRPPAGLRGAWEAASAETFAAQKPYAPSGAAALSA